MIRLVAVVAMLGSGASGGEALQAPQVRYFGTFIGYSHPLKLRGEMSESEAKSSDASYYVAHYDADGRNTKIEKFFRGKLITTYEYVYPPSGTAPTEMYMANDRGARRHFELRGKKKGKAK